jgi:hypothetical protein
MSSPANWNNGEFNPWVPQPAKDTAIANLRAAYPRTVFPLLTSDVAWAMLRARRGLMWIILTGVIEPMSWCTG